MYEFKKNLIVHDLEASNQNEVIDQIGNIMINENISTSEYIEAIKKRELKYPTGLNTQVMPVAMPHATSEGVLKTDIVVAKLKKTVEFNSMENPDNKLDVKIVFMLAIKGEGHVEMLRQLMKIFSDKNKMYELNHAEDLETIYKILNR